MTVSCFSSSKKVSSVPTTSAFSWRRWRTRERSRMRRSTPSAGQEGIAENLFRFLADAIHAARALDEADDGPGQIEIHDDGGILEVLAFAEDVGGDQHAEFLGGGT